MTLHEAGLTITPGMTTPSRPGKQPRPVWNVVGHLQPWASMLLDLGGKKWGRGYSFWSDPTAAIEQALETTAPDSYADRRAAFQERAEARAERREEWAEKATARSEAAFSGAHAEVAGIPMGQPILVGHHSERRHRAALARHDAKMRRGFAESELASHHAARAAAAEHNAQDDSTRSVAFITRRITDAEREIRALDRIIASCTRDADTGRTVYGHNLTPEQIEEKRRHVARVELMKADEVGKLEYWRARMAEAGGCQYTRDTIQPGDRVRPRGHSWAVVVRCNAKTVSLEWTEGALKGLGGKYPYAELTGHERPA